MDNLFKGRQAAVAGMLPTNKLGMAMRGVEKGIEKKSEYPTPL